MTFLRLLITAMVFAWSVPATAQSATSIISMSAASEPQQCGYRSLADFLKSRLTCRVVDKDGKVTYVVVRG